MESKDVAKRKLGGGVGAMLRHKREETEGLAEWERSSDSPPLGRERKRV
jgi:hypothetical protein